MYPIYPAASYLELTAVDDRSRDFRLDFTIAGTGGLDGSDNGHRLIVGDLAKDDVLAIEPASNDSGDEELGAVAGWTVSTYVLEAEME
jgi:hypothetical protein